METALQVDLATQQATATVSIAPSQQPGISFDIGALEIASVTSALGTLRFRQQEGRLDIGVPATEEPFEIVIDYRFEAQDDFNGWMPETGVSFFVAGLLRQSVPLPRCASRRTALSPECDRSARRQDCHLSAAHSRGSTRLHASLGAW
ncbi:hypothetical protein [Algiphilus sp.]|uniref:hypothetical protein n=1 Tax=Algiphilus sp. TaxID=1872431 RepID=UPI0032EF236B